MHHHSTCAFHVILRCQRVITALTSYDLPPLYDVTIEEFETCALDRLRILAEIESSHARNRSWDELKNATNAQCEKYLPLSATISRRYADLDTERKKDHLSHFVLRLAFCRSCAPLFLLCL